MPDKPSRISRRLLLKTLCAGAGACTIGPLIGTNKLLAQEPGTSLPAFTGPGANPYWNSVGPVVTYPQKFPLVLLTDRPVQLETPRNYFLSPITPNGAFFVRWHLDEIPTAVDLSQWRLQVEGSVEHPLKLSTSDLMTRYPQVSLTAVNQCSGNSRSRLQPRVPGGQWGNGAMGNAVWTGAKLGDVLRAAGVKKGATMVQFEGLDRGKGEPGFGSHIFLKSLELKNPVLEECIVAYAMNGEPLPMLNGFPARLVVPGYFSTYWLKALSAIRLLDGPDENFWMKTGYRIPDTPRGSTTPEDVKAGKVKTVPINRMPVRSFLITPDGSSKMPAGMAVTLRGIAFSGYGKVVKVAVSDNDGKTWHDARLGEDLGPYSFRAWSFSWKPGRAGSYKLAVRATDEKGNVQPDEATWNPGGYLWNKIERQEIVVGTAE
jgi:DMSO/TMAO reductase YedYZ molybdopterin-dependent catalytic subunit